MLTWICVMIIIYKSLYALYYRQFLVYQYVM
jgi:hypothetical protein